MRRVLAPAMLLMCTLPALAGSGRWLHVRAVEQTGSGARVTINVPLSVVEALAPMISEKSGHRIRIRVEEQELNAAELRQIVQQLRSGADGRLMTVSKRGGETTVIEKAGANLVIRNTEPDGRTTNVTLHANVLAALVSSRDERLDVAAAVRALAAVGSGDLVFVNDGNDTVRIWIDGTPEGGQR